MSLAGFDLETHKLQPGLLAPPIVCAQYAHAEASRGVVTLDWYHAFVAIHQYTLAGANIAFDMGCLVGNRPDLFPAVWRAYEEGRVWDTSIAATLNAIADGRLTDHGLFFPDGTPVPKGRYSLDATVKEFLGRDDAKKNDRWRTSYALLEKTPIHQWPADALAYCYDDAINSWQVAQAQQNIRNKHEVAFQSHLAFCAHLGSMWGLRADPARVDSLEAEYEAKTKQVQEWAVAKGYMRATKKGLSKNMAAIKERVTAAYGGSPPTTDKGGVSTERQVLEDSGDEDLEKVAHLSTKASTYFPPLKQAARVPLNVSCNPVLATGRASYSGVIQLLPRKGGFRECFVPRAGHYYSSVDYTAIEMSTLAQVCYSWLGRSALRDAINGGKDIHCIMAADLLGRTYEEVTDNGKVRPEYKNIRQAGKACNFGFPGMMGVAKFVLAQRRAGFRVCEWFYGDGRCGETKTRFWGETVLEVPTCVRCLERAHAGRTTYLQRWTEIRPYWQRVEEELARNGDAVEQLFSRRIRGGLSAPQAANTMFQGLAADGAKRAVVALTREMYLDESSPLFGSRLVVFSHDETILEVPIDRAELAATRQVDIMVREMRKVVPDVEVKAAPTLMTEWAKEAEPVYENGRLVPWKRKEEA